MIKCGPTRNGSWREHQFSWQDTFVEVKILPECSFFKAADSCIDDLVEAAGAKDPHYFDTTFS